MGSMVRFHEQRVLVVALAASLCGCPSPGNGEPSSLPELAQANLIEVEPNDEVSQALGVVDLPLVVGGTMSSCGGGGSYAGSDIDRFSFSVAEPSRLLLRLEVLGGDLDLRLYDPEGDLMADEDTPGIDAEELQLSIGPGQDYGLEVRCWMGSTPEWRLHFLADLQR